MDVYRSTSFETIKNSISEINENTSGARRVYAYAKIALPLTKHIILDDIASTTSYEPDIKRARSQAQKCAEKLLEITSQQ